MIELKQNSNLDWVSTSAHSFGHCFCGGKMRELFNLSDGEKYMLHFSTEFPRIDSAVKIFLRYFLFWMWDTKTDPTPALSHKHFFASEDTDYLLSSLFPEGKGKLWVWVEKIS